ncbi:type II toxin-antitoxin system HipA family toxin [Bradyrhizobium japonicum]|uniref:type II toxin-antitoxin system HipA family toxin n=1 Tax=Bradyrhizobium japonicum TaxID=375 RepID=UPI0004569811|nr:type II toxin-antitoxin system HipA family toxin [Bradyrhizobium japonicum]AHY48623.1 Serine/threonine-protein kinase HipA [Bradyrhizobium japonicum SEMIA 5079]MCD9112317.1 type II toxin-antitoxin system HipA family toxin [Bradyrhizobium japonicum]MCD9258193.1 type II toxin-antitoxin system HipA family toxin [Bradyrhizobium japonicum SEMIA 5079]MCD9824553.1 type II toxin-antitoxin system HipA family toxin [Bradyrhizobium japonicum]MCD9897244.1 type II toxin-antitoxin system HipA family toxi
MARRPARAPLNVYLNARLVGRLRRESSGAIDFQYDKQWLAWENAIPVSVSLPLREDRYIGDPVVAVFDNLLPDNDDIRRRVAERAHADGADAYSLLSAIGRDCIGALQFLPDSAAPGGAGAIDGRAASDQEIAAILGNLASNPLGIGPDQDFRISLAGAQEKTALLYWKDKWHVPHGTTATTHIIKPQIGKLPNGIDLTGSVENEHLCLELVAALGLPVAKSSIIDFAGRRVLAVERFDRIWTRDGRLLRLPQEDCCQALSVPPARKYESDGGPGIRKISDFLKGSDTPEDDQAIFFKAQIVFWLLAATDGHAKNFSIHLAPGGRFHLAPLYDIISTQPSLDAGQISQNQMKLAMAIGSNRHYIVHTVLGRHFVQTAKSCGLPDKTVKVVIQQLGDTAAKAIDQVLNALPKGFPEKMAISIADGAKSRVNSLAVLKSSE